MAGFNQVNKIKQKHKEELDALQVKYDELLLKYNKLEEDYKNLKKDLNGIGQGSNRIKQLENDLKKANHRISQLEAREKSKDANTVFSLEQQKIIAAINRLSSLNDSYEMHFKKFKDGMNEMLVLARKIESDNAKEKDYYNHIFRDKLISIYEKVLCVLTGKYLNINAILLGLKEGKYSIGKQYIELVPQYKDKDLYQYLIYLIHLENHAYHGSQSIGKKEYAIATYSYKNAKEFINLTKEEKINTLFSILELIYVFFTEFDVEQSMVNYSSCWKTTIE